MKERFTWQYNEYYNPIIPILMESDKYAWIKDRDRKNEKVIRLLNEENRRFEEFLKGTEKLQRKLLKEFKSRIKGTYDTCPYRYGRYFYFLRYSEGKEHPVVMRRRGRKVERVLDWNEIAKGHEFFCPGGVKFSKDGRFMAFSYDISGDENFKMYIKDLETGRILDTIEGVHWDEFSWTNDNKILYVLETEDTKRPYRIMIKDMYGKEEEIFREDNPSYFVFLHRTPYGYVFAECGNTETTFSTLIYPYKREFFPPQRGIKYRVRYGEGKFYILTNDNAPNYKVLSLDEKTDEIKEMIEEGEPIDDIQVFKDFIAVEERHEGFKSIRIVHTPDFKSDRVRFGEEAYAVWLQDNYEYDTHKLRMGYSSLRTPKTIYEYNIRSGKLRRVWSEEIPGYNKRYYESRRIYATSYDGTKVPISMVYRKDKVKRDRKNFVFLVGYGAYGMPYDPTFNRYVISLLDRGFIYAIAHIRGGGEFGERWHKEGKLGKKKNTIYDFVECAEHLIIDGWTDKGKIIIQGSSAGGITVGGAINLKPELFAACLAIVPFVDVLNTMLDPTLPLTIQEYDEWGNPSEKSYYDYIKSYSPYENVRPQKYPAVLAWSGLHDPRVGYWEPTKWVLKLRENNLGNNPILLKTDMKSGHVGKTGRYEYMEEVVQRYAFVLKVIKKTT